MHNISNAEVAFAAVSWILIIAFLKFRYDKWKEKTNER